MPGTYKSNSGLARWVAFQRENWPKLSAEQLLALIRLDFAFNPSDTVWVRRFGELAEAARKGKKVADLWQENNSLWAWVSYQRNIRDKLSPEKVRLLEEMGVEWNPRESSKTY